MTDKLMLGRLVDFGRCTGLQNAIGRQDRDSIGKRQCLGLIVGDINHWFILLGKNGSAIEGRAAPIKSSTPPFTAATIDSGEVYLPNGLTILFIN